MENITAPQWIIVIVVIGLWILFGKNIKKITKNSPATKKKNKAIKMGHTIVGVCIFCKEDKSMRNSYMAKHSVGESAVGESPDPIFDVIFEYYVNGVRYTYKTYQRGVTPLGKQRTLYYLDNPSKAFEDPGIGATPSLIFVFIPIIVGVLLTLFFRYLGLM